MPRPNPLTAAFCLMLCLAAPVAQADLRVTFDEGAPKDRFRFENTGACDLADFAVTVDLSSSAGGLIFDVTGSGAGVQVFQPFEMVEGADALAAVPLVVDGQTTLQLVVARLARGEAIGFTIDVDDTLGSRAITVSGAEIAGAAVRIDGIGDPRTATFSTSAEATVSLSGC